MALVISVVYRQHAHPVALHIVGAQKKGPGLTLAAGYFACWSRPCRPRCRCMCSVTKGWAVGTCRRRLRP